MNYEAKRDAVVKERQHKNRKFFTVDYSPNLTKEGSKDWITFGVYFSKEDATFVRDIIKEGKLNLLRLGIRS